MASFGGLFILSGGLLLLLSGGLLLLGLRLSGGLLLLDFLPRSLGLYSGLSLGLLLREALLPVLLCEVLLLLQLLCLSLSWPVAGDKVRLLGIWEIRKGFRPLMLLIRIVKNEFYKEIDKCIKELEGIFTIWKLICELTGRNFFYIYFSAANFTYQLELDGFGPNAIKIVKLIK